MKKMMGFILAAVCLAACASPDKKDFTGIDYSAYERPSLRNYDDYTATVPVPSVLDEPVFPAPENNEPQPLSEDEDFTSEEIAAAYDRYTDVTIVAAVKRVKLGSAAKAKHMSLFQQALDTGYKKALRTYRPSGFTYSISSVGPVNPLSDIEVRCILGERAASDVGQQTCSLFFNTVIETYNQLYKEAKQNAAL